MKRENKKTFYFYNLFIVACIRFPTQQNMFFVVPKTHKIVSLRTTKHLKAVLTTHTHKNLPQKFIYIPMLNFLSMRRFMIVNVAL